MTAWPDSGRGDPLRVGQFVWTEYGPGRQLAQVASIPHTRVGFKVYAYRWSRRRGAWTRRPVDVTGRVIRLLDSTEVPERVRATARVRV